MAINFQFSISMLNLAGANFANLNSAQLLNLWCALVIKDNIYGKLMISASLCLSDTITIKSRRLISQFCWSTVKVGCNCCGMTSWRLPACIWVVWFVDMAGSRVNRCFCFIRCASSRTCLHLSLQLDFEPSMVNSPLLKEGSWYCSIPGKTKSGLVLFYVIFPRPYLMPCVLNMASR